MTRRRRPDRRGSAPSDRRRPAVPPRLEALEARVLLDGFPFTIHGDQFRRDGEPVFLCGLGYQPLEPAQAVTGEIREARVQDDLRRLRGLGGGTDPVVVRVYAQPTATYPVRMPQSFYDGLRDLDFWIIRDVYFDADYTAADAVARGQARIDAVVAEVSAVGGMDRIFAWQIGNEFSANTGAEIAALETFLTEMRNHLKARMAEPGREDWSNWVTWGSWPPSDPLRTDGNPILPGCFDFLSYNAYPYEPDRIRDHQPGPATAAPYAGYLAALMQAHPGLPLVISETGLPDSAAVAPGHAAYPPWPPAYRKGGLSPEQAAEGIAQRYWDARLAGAAGFTVFEYVDEWHKAGDPNAQNDPEESFGLVRFDYNASAGAYEARSKMQWDTLRGLYTARAWEGMVEAIQVADADLAPLESTTLTAVVSPHAAGEVEFRWETSRGFLTADGETAELYAGATMLGPATVTVVAVDAAGHRDVASTVVTIQPGGAPAIEVLTLGSDTASGRVANVDLTQWKLACWIETTDRWVQPYADMTSVWVRPDGYWWTKVHNAADGDLHVYAVPVAYAPANLAGGQEPPAYLAKAQMTAANDADNDLLPTDWETTHLGGTGSGRHDDPDGDLASCLEEFLAGTLGGVADNDSDSDTLWDTWERGQFGRSSFDGNADPDGDGLDNGAEQQLGTLPGRASVDGDRDGLPDRWERRGFGGLAPQPGDAFSDGALTVLDAYELGLEPVALTGPAQTQARQAGEVCGVGWSGGDEHTTVDLFRFGPAGLAVMAADVASLDGAYEWLTTGAPQGWYCFYARSHNHDAWPDRPSAGPAWVQIGAAPAAPAVPVAAANGFDWTDGTWGVKVTGAPVCPITWPGGSKLGSDLEVYYTVSPQDIPQFWVFQSNGFWRQVSYDNSFATSYRLFRYYSSADEDRDTCQAVAFEVGSATGDGELPLALDYTNHAAAGDRFDVDADVLLAAPSEFLTSMTASVEVRNVTGDNVTSWPGHRDLAEQWELFGFSSMYVARHLTGGLPDWYDGLDLASAYVGNVADGDYMNDGFSQNGQIYVPTHDAGRIVSDGLVVELAHEEADCPHVVVDGLTWYEELVMLDQPSEILRLEHLHEPGRDHQAELLSAGGLVSDLEGLKWAATYDRNDANMVDGDNVQAKLGLDDVLNVWPAGTAQRVELRLTTGRAAAQPYFHADGRNIVADTTGEKTALRGLNLPGLEYGAFYDNPYPGVAGADYFAPGADDFDAVADMGLGLVRLPFEWARLVPAWQGPALPTALNADYLALLDAAVQAASDRGLFVLLDMHDYLKYWSAQSAYVLVNDSPPHQGLLAQTWKLLADHYADDTTVLGFDIMNEPDREPAGAPQWHAIAQAAVNAIRQVDANHLIVVEGLNYSLASHWTVENGAAAFVTDTASPGGIVYSPHVYFDGDNDSAYDGAGEDVGPGDGWRYYVRDRLAGALDWAVANDVPLLFGELGLPNTTAWSELLDHVFRYYFEPMGISAAVWQYLDRPEYYTDPLNLAADPDGPVPTVLRRYPGGPYAAAGDLHAVPQDSLLYDDARANPWHAGDGYWGSVLVDFAATDPVRQGDASLAVTFQDTYDGLKLMHHFGVDTQRYTHLEFWIYPTAAPLPDFRIFTSAPIAYWQAGSHPEYPAQFDDRPRLSDYAALTAGQWQRVRVPLADIVDPAQSIIDAVAFQNLGAAQAVFYLDEVRLVAPGQPVTLLGPSVRGDYEAGRLCGVRWTGGDSDTTVMVLHLGPAGLVVAATGADALAGCYDWPTAAVSPGWYTFAARALTDGLWADEFTTIYGWVRVL